MKPGEAAVPVAGDNFLTQEANPATAPVSYTLTFDRPMTKVTLLRAGLRAGPNGVTHPTWYALALDRDGVPIALVSEFQIRSFARVPAKPFILQAPESQPISGVRIASDYRLDAPLPFSAHPTAPGQAFAGFQSVLINSIALVK